MTITISVFDHDLTPSVEIMESPEFKRAGISLNAEGYSIVFWKDVRAPLRQALAKLDRFYKDIPESELINNAIANLVNPGAQDLPRWWLVKNLFGIDRDKATNFCLANDLNPYDRLPPFIDETLLQKIRDNEGQ